LNQKILDIIFNFYLKFSEGGDKYIKYIGAFFIFRFLIFNHLEQQLNKALEASQKILVLKRREPLIAEQSSIVLRWNYFA